MAIFASVHADRVWAEIDLDALTHNLAVVRELAGAGTRVLLVVKADAYGHGAPAIAHHALRCGIGALGVGTSAEALELRAAGVRATILVLGTVVEDELRDCLRHDVHIGLHAMDRCRSLQALARGMGVVASVHLNVDTGMGRLGVPPERALALLRELRASSNLRLAGVMTHVAAPDGALDPSSGGQMRRFEGVLAQARAQDLLRGWLHASSSASLFTGLASSCDTVRPGIAAYGALPAHLPHADRLRPVLTLRTQVVFLKDVPAGAPIGYGSTWRAPRPSRIATLPVGYSDGLLWRPAARGPALIRGRRAPIVGRVSMDYTTIDVTEVAGVHVGDLVTFLGQDGGACIGIDEVARACDALPYEISCSLGQRVRRVYRGGETLPLPAQAPPELERARPRLSAGAAPAELRQALPSHGAD